MKTKTQIPKEIKYPTYRTRSGALYKFYTRHHWEKISKGTSDAVRVGGEAFYADIFDFSWEKLDRKLLNRMRISSKITGIKE